MIPGPTDRPRVGDLDDMSLFCQRGVQIGRWRVACTRLQNHTQPCEAADPDGHVDGGWTLQWSSTRPAVGRCPR